MSLVAGFLNCLLAFLNFISQGKLVGNPSADPLKEVSDPSPFINYQIDAPTTDYGREVFKQTLLEHEFGASWGSPLKVDYTPPDADTEFSHVKLKLSVWTFGIQYDRLAHISLNDVEIWRPSTSEPRGRQSFSEHTKDVSAYYSLFTQPAELAFELNNLVTERLNGTFSVVLTAHYFDALNASSPNTLSPNEWYEHNGKAASDVRNVLGVQVATSPVAGNISTVARNTTRAVVEVFASGNGNDEFWYIEDDKLDRCDEDRLEAEDELDLDSSTSDLLSSRPHISHKLHKPDTKRRANPIRHILVKINGELAGGISPFYQIYTGGMQPALWSPFVAPFAYDVPSYQVDVTPFLPLLWEKEQSELELIVLDGNGKVVHNEWIMSASLLLWETSGVYGEGVKHPTVEKHKTDTAELGNMIAISFTQKLNVTSDLKFHGPDGPTTRVNWIQQRSISASLIGSTTIAHNSDGKSTTYYDSIKATRSYDYGLALNLDEHSISVSLDSSTHDSIVEPSHHDDILSRGHHVAFNGTWWSLPNSKQGKHLEGPSKNHKLNGSDVKVSYRDPHRLGPETFHQHAVSRDGSVITLNVTLIKEQPDNHALDVMDVMDGNHMNVAFPLGTRLSETEVAQRRKIRKRWLKHQL